MNGLAILLWSLLLCSVCTTITTLASSGNAITSHYKNAKYQESSPSSGILSTVAGYKTKNEGSTADGILATSKKLGGPRGLAIDNAGNTFIAGYSDNLVYKVTASSGIITKVAGAILLNYPNAVALDTTGNIYISDSGNNRIRKVTVSSGEISTVAGNGKEGYISDNVAATSTSLYGPSDVAVDATGNIFIADTKNGRIRKVTASTGIITTIAGTGDSTDVSKSRGNIATEYHLWGPTGVALDSAGNVYIAGSQLDPCVLKVTVSTGIITVVAGTGPYSIGTAGYNGDDILATKAQLSDPSQVAFDASDNMFINDAANYRIRRVSASTGIIKTVAGTGSAGSYFSTTPIDGDGGSAILQSLLSPNGLAVVASGNFYFSDGYLNVVKKVTYATGTPSSSVTAAPAVTPAVTPSTPSTATAPTPSVSSPSSSSSSPSISKAPAVTPSASSPSSPSSTSISKAPSTSSTTGSQSSATTHVAQTLHVTMILLSSLLILHLC